MNAWVDAEDLDALAQQLEQTLCEGSLYEFLVAAWPWFDSARFIPGWHLGAIAEHLQAVSDGEIKRLLINVAPRTSKTNLVAVAWPVWTWALPPNDEFPLHGPQVRFLCASYGASKAQGDGLTARRLIASSWYQRLWGHRVQIAADRDNQEQYDTLAGGSRISTGIPESLGKGGAIKILDDPHKVDQVESPQVLEAQVRAYREVWKTRSNDPQNGAEVIIMQRLGQGDLSGHVLGEGDVTHLMLPMEYDPSRHCVTVLGYEDPRGLDAETGELVPGLDERTGKIIPGSPLDRRTGELMWPERFDRAWARKNAEEIGPYAWASQFQQAPVPRGGGIIDATWWQLWEPVAFPDFSLVIASLDGAYTEKEINDPSGFTIWGCFNHPRTGRPNVMLRDAWRAHLPIDKLVERVAEDCTKHKVDVLLVEGKASGISVAQEIKRLYGARRWQTLLIQPVGDKYQRLMQVAPLFAAKLVYAPDREWADMVIDEVTNFPRAKHDDLADSTSQALHWLRRTGGAVTREEHDDAETEARRFKKAMPVLYDV